MQSSMLKAGVALAVLGGAMGAQAATVPFTGSMVGRGAAGPDPTCAPLPFRAILGPVPANSSLGGFQYQHNNCFAGVVGPVDGAFTFNFGADLFSGALTGTTALSGTPDISILDWTYTILGGTGRFAGATGSFKGIGTSDRRMPPALVTLDFMGEITAPGIPEPGTWTMMILGFGAIGALVRRRVRQFLGKKSALHHSHSRSPRQHGDGRSVASPAIARFRERLST